MARVTGAGLAMGASDSLYRHAAAAAGLTGLPNRQALEHSFNEHRPAVELARLALLENLHSGGGCDCPDDAVVAARGLVVAALYSVGSTGRSEPVPVTDRSGRKGFGNRPLEAAVNDRQTHLGFCQRPTTKKRWRLGSLDPSTGRVVMADVGTTKQGIPYDTQCDVADDGVAVAGLDRLAQSRSTSTIATLAIRTRTRSFEHRVPARYDRLAISSKGSYVALSGRAASLIVTSTSGRSRRISAADECGPRDPRLRRVLWLSDSQLALTCEDGVHLVDAATGKSRRLAEPDWPQRPIDYRIEGRTNDSSYLIVAAYISETHGFVAAFPISPAAPTILSPQPLSLIGSGTGFPRPGSDPDGFSFEQSLDSVRVLAGGNDYKVPLSYHKGFLLGETLPMLTQRWP